MTDHSLDTAPHPHPRSQSYSPAQSPARPPLTAGPAAAGARVRARVRSLGALRVIVSLHLLAVLLQALSAGLFFSGHADAVAAHATGSRAVGLLALAQVAAAVLFWRRGGGPGWFAGASAALLIADALQMGAGRAHLYWAHVPLGLLLFGGLARLQAWAFAQPLVPETRPSSGASPIGA